MIFNLAALAAFFLLSFVDGCRKAAFVVAGCLALQILTNIETVNFLTPNTVLPVWFVKTVLIGYFGISLTCQLIIIKVLRFRIYQFAIVSSLSAMAVINDTIGLAIYWAWLDLEEYNQRSMLIITLQLAAIWIFRNGNICVLHADSIRRLGDTRNSSHD